MNDRVDYSPMKLTSIEWTIDDYHRIVATGLLADRRVELLQGDIVKMPPESPHHAFTCGEKAQYLRTLLGDLALVREAHPITLPNNSEPQPDLAIVIPPAHNYRHSHPQPADIYWLIEIANTTVDIDLTIKRDIYAQAGILEYWVLNIRDGILIIFRDLFEGMYRRAEQHHSGNISPLAFPTLQIDIRQLLS
jgi:Uma2 family endonuclease